MQPGFSLIVTPDCLKAYLQVPPNLISYPTFDELVGYLASQGIINGIESDALDRIACGKVSPGLIEIAKGTPPQAGTAAKIELLVDTSGIGKPKVLTDGRVDHHDIGIVINVSKGVPLARRIPPSEGIDGKSVYGYIIPPPQSLDVNLAQGSGTVYSKDDPNTLLSDKDGALCIDQEGIIEVKDQKVIKNDIDYSTGNIKFAGDLLILGSVRAGFSVETNGDLKIKGSVEDSHIISHGNIEIGGGAVGAGTGSIECNGFLRVRHVENFSIRSGGNVTVYEDALHSTIITDGCIKVKSIIGGKAICLGIECDVIGSAAETKTIIDIGKVQLLISEKEKLEKKAIEIVEQIKNLNLQIFKFVRDSMEPDGVLCEENEKILASLKQKKIESMQVNFEIKNRINEIEQTNKKIKIYSGVAAKNIFPNTLIKYGNGERLIMETISDVKLFSRNK